MKKVSTLIIFALVGAILNAQNVNIPDANFKAALVGNSLINTNGDTEIQVSEAQAYTGGLLLNYQSISDLTGIEAFTSLSALACNNNSLTSLDLSQNTALTVLYCSNNSLTSLDITQNTALTYVLCLGNSLSSIDLSQNTALTTINCRNNQLTSLDVSANTALIELFCNGNQLTSLDVSANTALTKLNCTNNQLTSLDVSANTALEWLYCHTNQLTSLDVSANTALEWLYCNGNQLTSLDVSTDTALTKLICYNNQLTSLDVSANTALTLLLCHTNQLTSLDVSANTALIELYCNNNQLTSLDVSTDTALTKLNCTNNQLTSLDVSANTALRLLLCNNNQLTSLNVANGNNGASFSNLNHVNATNNSNLTCIQHDSGFDPTTTATNWSKDATASWSDNCGGSSCANIVNIPDANFKNALINHSPTIDTDGDGEICDTEAQAFTGEINVDNQNISDLTGIEAFVNLTKLYCRNNQLTSLDVSANTALINLFCTNNQLTSLDVSANTALMNLYCNINQLTSLDVSANTALVTINCRNNQLTSLDVSANTALEGLYCNTNQLTSLDVSANTALRKLFCHTNQLTSLNVANGNNGLGGSELNYVDANNNPNLTCIQHDSGFDPTTATNWSKDATASWSDNCGGSTCANIVNIPDTNFKNALINHSPTIDTDGDGEICDTEAQAFTGAIDVGGLSISDLTGVEAFVNAIELYCNNNQLTSLDVSANTALTNLYCRSNQLTSLDLSANTALTTLECNNNQLTSLDVSANTALTTLDCRSNQLTSLDFSANTALTTLYCNNNQLNSLDLSANTALTTLLCNNNQLNSLDVSANTALRALNCNNNQLTSLNVANDNNGSGSFELSYVEATSNPNLSCIQHDAGFDPSTLPNWLKDATAQWSDSCIILVNSISVQAQNGDTTISTNGGTLQMEATVLPANADDMTYTWSVTNGTGSATIDQNGVLTATANGTVTVTATANDGSGTTGSVVITISNQGGVGINDIAFKNLKVYPNPAKDILYVEVEENLEQIQLIDLSGKVVKTFDAESKQLDISNVEKGIYFIKINNHSKQSVQKVVVQ